ncbi:MULTISPECIES: hypothetical protein [unclassified Pseudomonas]|jgi:hypothetical protein|uniref:hypothetical protein n=1 Tax=unclassified Pseudomonas TaxID=196821 RepID=UPI002114F790|nr:MULTISPECIES: hypothetical protein [unclassified Pseudomonas]
MNRFSIRPMLSALLLLPLIYAIPATAEAGSCYGYLTEMVRSSNFPFRYVGKEGQSPD